MAICDHGLREVRHLPVLWLSECWEAEGRYHGALPKKHLTGWFSSLGELHTRHTQTTGKTCKETGSQVKSDRKLESRHTSSTKRARGQLLGGTALGLTEGRREPLSWTFVPKLQAGTLNVLLPTASMEERLLYPEPEPQVINTL